MNDYEQRKQDRIDRYLEKAEKARAESSALSQQAHTMLSAIPPGQPMPPDHYSYKSDKRYRDRIDTKMRQSISADEKAFEAASKLINKELSMVLGIPEASVEGFIEQRLRQ